MLAPDSLTPIEDALGTFYAEVRTADQLSMAGGSLRFCGGVSQNAWVVHLQNRMKLLERDATAWQDHKLVVLPSILAPFSRYQKQFRAAAPILATRTAPSEAVGILNSLWEEIQRHEKSARLARTEFEDWVGLALTNLDGMNESLQDAWLALGAAERRIVTLTQRITAVQMELDQLEGVISLTSLSGAPISSMTSLFANVVSMVYKVAIAGGAMPYLTAVKAFFTLGKLFVTIFTNSAAVQKKLKELVRCRQELDAAQQGLAMTKAALTSLYDLRSLLEKQQTSLAAVEGFWQNEARNICTVRDKFALMPAIPADDPELTQLPIAQATWTTLRGISDGLLDNLTQGVHAGTEIVLAT